MRDRQGARFAVWLALLGVCAWIGMHTPMEPATTWPEGSSREQELLAVYAKNNLDSHLILLMLEGPGADELAHASRQLATALRASDLFLLVANGDPEMTAADRAFLWQHRYLLSTSVAFGAAQIRSGLERANPATLMADPSDEFSQVTAGMPASRANLQHGAWLSLETTRALLFVVTRPSGADAQRIASDVIVRAHAALSSGTRLTLTGPALRATASLNPRPFGGVLVLWGMLILASRRVPWWTIPPVLAALVAGAAAVGLWYGKVQLSNFSFAGILVALALLQSLVHRALAQRQATAWRGIAVHPATLIFVLTIAAAALLMASPVPAAAQAGLGLSAGMSATWWTLIFLRTAPVVADAAWPDISCALCQRFREWATQGKRRQAALLAIGAVLLFGVAALSSQTKVSSSQLHDEKELREVLGIAAPEVIVAARGATEQAALEAADALVARVRPALSSGVISGFDAPTRYLPSESAQLARQAALPEPDELRAELTRALAGTRLRPESFKSFLDDVDAARGGALTRESLALTSFGTRVKTMLHEAPGEWIAWIHLYGVRDFPSLATALAQEQVTPINVQAETQALRSVMLRTGVSSALAVLALLLAGAGSLTRSARAVATRGMVLLSAVGASLALSICLGDATERAIWLPLAAGVGASLIALELSWVRDRQGVSAVAVAACLILIGAFSFLLIDGSTTATGAASAVIASLACLSAIGLLARAVKTFARGGCSPATR